MTEDIFSRFDSLCGEFEKTMSERDSDGIGTYNEKILHKALKHAVCKDPECLEVKVGTYFADVLCDGEIFEIQTGGFYPLVKKIEYFLENTDYKVTVVHPLVSELLLIRVDGETGEVIRKKRSPKRERPCDILPELFYLRHIISSERVRFLLPQISGEEYRFSERVRGRKSGAYDAQFFPLCMIGLTEIKDISDIRSVLPAEIRDAESFDSTTFAKALRLRGRRLSQALKFLCDVEILTREKDGRKYIYYIIKDK
jgi:hypothetical protein